MRSSQTIISDTLYTQHTVDTGVSILLPVSVAAAYLEAFRSVGDGPTLMLLAGSPFRTSPVNPVLPSL